MSPAPCRNLRLCGLGWLTGDEDGEDQADQGDHEHDGEGDGEGLPLGKVDGDQHRADEGGAERGSEVGDTARQSGITP